jgi:hypothetical protein
VESIPIPTPAPSTTIPSRSGKRTAASELK